MVSRKFSLFGATHQWPVNADDAENAYSVKLNMYGFNNHIWLLKNNQCIDELSGDIFAMIKQSKEREPSEYRNVAFNFMINILGGDSKIKLISINSFLIISIVSSLFVFAVSAVMILDIKYKIMETFLDKRIYYISPALIVAAHIFYGYSTWKKQKHSPTWLLATMMPFFAILTINYFSDQILLFYKYYIW